MTVSNEHLIPDRQCGGPGIWTGVGCPADHGCSNQTTCGEVTVPASHLASCLLCDREGQCRRSQERSGSGVTNTDLILYISSKLSTLCQESQTLSHAGHCHQVRCRDIRDILTSMIIVRNQIWTDLWQVMSTFAPTTSTIPRNYQKTSNMKFFMFLDFL